MVRPRTLPLLRLVLAVSLDGRLAPAAASLVGAESLRRHGSTCLIHHPDLLACRQRSGRTAQPIAIAVSASGRLPTDLPFFRQPLMLGGGHGWLPQGAILPAALQEGWRLLEHRHLGGEELLLRYGRAELAADPAQG